MIQKDSAVAENCYKLKLFCMNLKLMITVRTVAQWTESRKWIKIFKHGLQSSDYAYL
jgi:hypothetical protein